MPNDPADMFDVPHHLAVALAELEARLTREPFTFDFFQAVRRLECLHADLPRIGASKRLAEDPVRFAQPPSMHFAPASITGYTPRQQDRPPRLDVAFFGLFGPHGPLPLHLTEHARARQLHHGDQALVGFANMFHHRLISLFYRAWASARVEVSHDRESDRFAVYIASLIGMGMDSLRTRGRVPDAAKLFFAGHLACPTRHPDGLRQILEAYLHVPARIVEYHGRWISIPPDCRCRLGESPATGALGSSVLVGERIWECQHAIRIVLGPMDFPAYTRMLPNGPTLARISDWVEHYTTHEHDCEIQLVLRREQVPTTRLGDGARLGWTTWISTHDQTEDRGDMLLRPCPVHERQ